MSIFETHRLSPTETRVCALVMAGYRNGEIADTIFRSPKTVYTTKCRAFRKLGVGSPAELYIKWLEDRLASAPAAGESEFAAGYRAALGELQAVLYGN